MMSMCLKGSGTKNAEKTQANAVEKTKITVDIISDPN